MEAVKILQSKAMFTIVILQVRAPRMKIGGVIRTPSSPVVRGKKEQAILKNIPVLVFSIENLVLRFISDLKTFTNAANLLDMKTSTRSALTLEDIRNSSDIYKQQNCASIL